MSEQKKAEGEKQENSTVDNNAGVQSQTENFLQKLEELKQVDESLGKKLKEFREIESSRLLGSSAGVRKEPEESKPESAKEYADRVMGNQIK